MILSANAIVYLESPYKKEQDIAKQHKRGLWQGRFMQPRLFRRLKEQEKAN
jgi:endonuclease YncB( thermonuclease family)